MRGYDSGAVDFLFKPIDSTVLLSKVRIFLELYSARQTEARAAHELRLAHGELQLAYRELQTTQSQLVQSAKMASLGELVAGVAHEINNPLAFVLSHLETTRRSLDAFRQDVPEPLPERAVDHWQKAETRLSEIEGGLGRIRDLVLKLRTFSRLDEGERKSVSVSECIDSVLTILGHKLKDRVEVVRQLSGQDELECYPSLLNQVLLNLVANAIDAIDPEKTGTITIGAGARGEEFVITIADTGAGIPSDLKERVFEPFFTTKPVGEGTGLGLSIAYSIMKKHAGSLELSDAQGGGTLATLRIPLHMPAAD
jgi:two-component system NtrC family sensor kinase